MARIEVKQQSTLIIRANFYDENDNAVTPDTMAWSLVDENEVVINDREDVDVEDSDLSTYVDIVLYGDDLDMDSGYSEQKRYLVLEGTYTNDDGLTLPIRESCEFVVVDLMKVE